MSYRSTTISALMVTALYLLSPTLALGSNQTTPRDEAKEQPMKNAAHPHPYVGMWVTDDGNIRHNLLPNGRYDEARGSRESAYQGRYEVTERHIDYWDDTGFTADGEFVDQNTLHHGGMIFRRR